MAAINDFLEGLVNPTYMLIIDGYPGVFYQTVAPTISSGHLPLYGTAVPGLEDVEGIKETLSTARAGAVGIVKAKTVSLAIAPSDDLVGPGGDTDEALATLVNDLLRTGPDGADEFFTLATTLPKATGAVGIEVNEDLTGVAASGVLWVGLEAIKYDSITLPSTFNVGANGRGWYGSRIQSHVANPSEGWTPQLFTNCVNWEGRRVSLRLLSEWGNGQLAPGFLERVRGYMVGGGPIEEQDGTISIQIAPLASLFDDAVVGGAEAETGLQHGKHIFDGFTAMKFGGVSVGYGDGDAFDVRTTGAATVLPTAIVNAVPYRAHDEVFDPTAGESARRGIVRIGREPNPFEVDPVAPYGGDADNGTLKLKSNLTVAIPAGTFVRIFNAAASHPYEELIAPVGAPVAVDWPAGALATLNAALAPGSTHNVNGRFADLRLERENAVADGAALTVRVNSSLHKRGPTLRMWYLLQDPHYIRYGISLADPSDFVPRPLAQHRRRRQIMPWRQREFRLESRNTQAARDVFGIAGIADQFWEQERWIYVIDDVFGPPPFNVQVRWKDGDEERETRPRIIAKEAASVQFPGLPGFLLEVDDVDRWGRLPFGDWPGQERAVLRQLVQWRDVRPPTIVLQLMNSGEGNALNGPDDVVPYGMDIDQRDIDVPSFESMPVPGGLLSSWSLMIDEEREVKTVAGNINAALDSAIVHRLNPTTGRRRLAMVQMGTPVWVDAVETITDADWDDEDLVGSEVRFDVINVVNTVPADGTPIRNTNRPAITALGRLEELDLELEGVELPALSPADRKAAMMPLATDIFAARSYPVRTLTGRLPWFRALKLDVGSVALVTALHARGPKGKRLTVNAVPMKLIEKADNGENGVLYTDVVFEWADARTSGRAPSMRFASRVDDLTFDVEPNEYTLSEHPITGAPQTDAGYYAAGDAIEIIPDGNFAGRVTTQIDTIVGSRVTVVDPHGLVNGDAASIDPGAFSVAPARLRLYIFFASDGGVIGVGAIQVDAFVYAG